MGEWISCVECSEAGDGVAGAQSGLIRIRGYRRGIPGGVHLGTPVLYTETGQPKVRRLNSNHV